MKKITDIVKQRLEETWYSGLFDLRACGCCLDDLYGESNYHKGRCGCVECEFYSKPIRGTIRILIPIFKKGGKK